MQNKIIFNYHKYLIKKALAEELLDSDLLSNIAGTASDVGNTVKKLIGDIGDAGSNIKNKVDVLTDKQPEEDQLQQSMASFNDLANKISSILSEYNQTDPTGTFTDPEKLREYIGDNYSVNFLKDASGIIAALVQFFQQADTAGLFKLDPNFIYDTFNFTFDFYKRNNYNASTTIGKLQELGQQAILNDDYVVSVIKKDFAHATVAMILSNLGSPSQDLENKVNSLGILANKMLKDQSVELVNFNKLKDAENRTTFTKLLNAKAKFEAFAPVREFKQSAIQDLNIFGQQYFGSQLGKALANNPVTQGYTAINTIIGSLFKK